jgi:hypothetical protein
MGSEQYQIMYTCQSVQYQLVFTFSPIFFFHHREALFILCDHISSLCRSGWATTVSMTYHAFIIFRCVSYFSTCSFAQRIVNAAVLLFGLQSWSWLSADVDRI